MLLNKDILCLKINLILFFEKPFILKSYNSIKFCQILNQNFVNFSAHLNIDLNFKGIIYLGLEFNIKYIHIIHILF